MKTALKAAGLRRSPCRTPAGARARKVRGSVQKQGITRCKGLLVGGRTYLLC